MKRLLLLTLTIFSIVLISCENDLHLNSLSTVKFNVSRERAISVNNPTLDDINSDTLIWYYKAEKRSSTSFNTGATDTFIQIPGTVSGKLTNSITLSRGSWSFTLQARDNENKILYQGSTDYYVGSSTANISINVSSIISGVNGYLTLNDIYILDKSGNKVKPNNIMIDNSISCTIFPDAQNSSVYDSNPIELSSGNHNIVISYVCDDITICSEVKEFTIHSSKTTTITGSVSEETIEGSEGVSLKLNTPSFIYQEIDSSTALYNTLLKLVSPYTIKYYITTDFNEVVDYTTSFNTYTSEIPIVEKCLVYAYQERGNDRSRIERKEFNNIKLKLPLVSINNTQDSLIIDTTNNPSGTSYYYKIGSNEIAQVGNNNSIAYQNGDYITIYAQKDGYINSNYLSENWFKKESYQIGDRGPAGGWIFYDCDADNNTGNQDNLVSSECGWRYMEAGCYDFRYAFGYYRTLGGTNQTVETASTIGSGKQNTINLVNAMGDTAFLRNNGSDKVMYAAKVCYDYVHNNYDDWYLPSIGELNLIYTNLYLNNKGDFAISVNDEGTVFHREYLHWSSSEYDSGFAYCKQFLCDSSLTPKTMAQRIVGGVTGTGGGFVRPIRYFK